MAPTRPTYRIIYGNDATHMESCRSPFNPDYRLFQPEMVEAGVSEVAGYGVDAQLFQPGHGMVPWWRSESYPGAEHYRWFRETYGREPDGFGQYMLIGGDIVRLFVDSCLKHAQAPFISLRLNNSRGLEYLDCTDQHRVPAFAGHMLCRFSRENPQYRLHPEGHPWIPTSTDPKDEYRASTVRRERQLNWVHPEVREYKLRFVRELAGGYPIAGLELDFLRQPPYFREDQTSPAERAAVMTEFVGAVRRILDASPGSRRWLCVRIPASDDSQQRMGVDPAAFAAAGVDMFNLSPSSCTVQTMDVGRIRELCPRSWIALEELNCTQTSYFAVGGEDRANFRRTTDEQFYTTAHLAYSAGADAISLFNFQYYRETYWGAPTRGPFCEPPLHVIPHLRDPRWLSRQPQHYFTSHVKLRRDTVCTAELRMAPPAGGWCSAGRLRAQCLRPWAAAEVVASLNGTLLRATDDISEPYPNPYPPLLGTPQTLRAWSVPIAAMRPGLNTVSFVLKNLPELEVFFVDLAVQ